MSTLRWLQEVEVIGRGFARPFGTLHMQERCGHIHRHTHLRRRLLVCSSSLLRSLRATTRETHTQACVGGRGGGLLERELADKHGYLAYTNLTHLYPHLMGEEGEEKEEEDLSLESIKASRILFLLMQLLHFAYLYPLRIIGCLSISLTLL